jgi:hypothetical protein
LRLAQTGEFWVAGDRAWEMPGNALFYAAIVRAFGAVHLIQVARTAQSVLLVLQALLVGWTAWRAFRHEWAAAIAALITAFYPYFLFYQGLLLSETLFNTLLVASFACLYWWRGRGARFDGSFFTTCLCFAAATMTKATLTVFLVILPTRRRISSFSLAGYLMRRRPHTRSRFFLSRRFSRIVSASASFNCRSSARISFTSSEVASRAVSPASRFLPASRTSFDQR